MILKKLVTEIIILNFKNILKILDYIFALSSNIILEYMIIYNKNIFSNMYSNLYWSIFTNIVFEKYYITDKYSSGLTWNFDKFDKFTCFI